MNYKHPRILYKAQKGRCFYCDCKLRLWNAYYGDGGWSVDHLLPKSKAPKGLKFNKVLACRPCNTRKGNRMPTTLEIFQMRVLYTIVNHLYTLTT